MKMIHALTAEAELPSQGKRHHFDAPLADEMPPRSKLYCLAPLGSRTAEVESLTSYIIRLAWAYRVNPRLLVAQEILPELSNEHYVQAVPSRLGSFSRT